MDDLYDTVNTSEESQIEATVTEQGSKVLLEIVISSQGRLPIHLHMCNLVYDGMCNSRKTIEAAGHYVMKIEISDLLEPWLIVITRDGQLDHLQEIVGNL